MYFKMFPKIQYNVLNENTFISLTNITKRAIISNNAVRNLVAYDFYDVRNGETPELVADLYYKNTYYHWLILVTNNITNVYEQWPRSISSLESFIKNKYDDPYGIHHYTINQISGDTNKEIIITDSNVENFSSDITYNPTLVTKFQHETNLNDAKRRIRLIKKEYAKAVIKEYRLALKENNV